MTRPVKRLAVCLLWLSLGVASAQGDFERRFEAAWRLVAERYWDLSQVAVDWDEVRARYAPDAAAVDGDDALYALLESMYQELGDNHSVFVPPARVLSIRELYGDLPCLGVFAVDDLSRGGNVSYRLLDGGIGFIELPDLVVAGSAQDLRAAVQTLVRQGASGLVLDLRGNPGGRLLEMMQAAGVFTGGFLWRVVTTWTLPVPYPALGGVETDLPLAVLVDAGVNSAAEGLAGALQTSGRATIVGETTAGNVEAVLPFCLADGSQAWIATGVLAPLLGATWEGRGVEPDLVTLPAEALEAALEFFRTRSE
ncbi:MAG: S41 family peptidase [Deinococcota bacterium]|jgi:carboxyl-terminal processing protease|nr:S41 family peptidase [Deinococcota bacterium]